MVGRLGIDVGGTFTDLLLLDESGKTHSLNMPNNPDNPVEAIADGIRRITASAGMSPGDLSAVVHGAPPLDLGAAPSVGLLVTVGFEHVLHLARGQKSSPIAGQVIATMGVLERIDAHGQVQQPVDEARAMAAVRALLDSGAKAIAVSLLNAASNAEHERNLKTLIADIANDVPVTLSSDVVPEAAEYERTVAAVADAACRPVLRSHFAALSNALQGMEISTSVRVARADGGSMSVNHAVQIPVEAVNAGAAAGIVAAARAASQVGCRDALAVDMGGAETLIGVILDGAPVITRKMSVAGVNLTLPSVSLDRAGVGGGSAVRITDHGALRVGPDSAADGPASFGGSEPTLTDANIVLGLIPASSGRSGPNTSAAENAIGRIADELGVTLHAAAQGIRDLANEKLYGALRQTVAASGLDVASAGLVAFGGAGPLHGNALGVLCGSRMVVIPPAPAMMSARGYVSARPRREFGQSCRRLLDDLNASTIETMLGDLGGLANAWLVDEGVAEAGRHLRYEADLRYRGQGQDISLDIKPDALSNWGLRDLAARFETAFENQHGVRLDRPIELVRVRAIAEVGAGRANGGLRGPSGQGDASEARVDEQRVYLDGNFQNAVVYRAEKLQSSASVAGPALVVSEGSTAVIHSGHTGVTDATGALLIIPNNGDRA